MTQLPIDAPGAAHGVGLFETMLVVRGRALQVDEHFARMLASCDALGFPGPDDAAFRRAVATAAASGSSYQTALRCAWVAGGDIDDPSAWILSTTMGEVPRVTLSRRVEGRVVTLGASFVRSLPRHKLTSYAVCVVGLRHAITAGADEALFVSGEASVLEGTSTNVFAVRGETFVTAPTSAGILPGVVRAWVISAALGAGLSVEERVPSVEEIRAGAFLTSSLTTLAEVRTLDGRPCARAGQAFGELRELWRREFDVA